MLIQKLREQVDFTPTEKVLADYLIENMEGFGSQTAKGLGYASYTSKATVLRLCKKLGYTSYGEFRENFQQELKSLIHFELLLSKAPFNEKRHRRKLLINCQFFMKKH